MLTRLNTCIYVLYICIYSDSYLCVPTELHIYIYIYIQWENPNHHVKVTSIAGSCSQHSILTQQSPPETTVGFYQVLSQKCKHSLVIAALPTTINKS